MLNDAKNETATELPGSSASTSSPAGTFDTSRSLFLALAAITIVFALLAGLRTVADNDLGWQLATGRWVAQHHQVFSTDVFSYTAYGRPWVYPVGSGLLFYAAFLLGGYAALSWAGALACAGTIALLLRRGSLVSAAIAILAMPLISYRSVPRADMFTTVLFAAYLSILWQNFQTGRSRLWLLPLLMIAWVNLHLGFIAGLGLVAAFAGLDVLEMFFGSERRRAAVQRLKQEWPWFAGTAAVTILNPWGWNLYSAIFRQNQAMMQHSEYVTEWFGLPLNWTVITSSISLRDPEGAVYLVLAAAILAILVALWQRQPGAALLLAVGVYESVKHIRMEALMSSIAIVVGGSVLHAGFVKIGEAVPRSGLRKAITITFVAFFALIAGMNSADILTNRRYLIRNDVNTFGAGIGWRYPQRAVEFLQRENPPGNIINTLDEGGFLLWTLGEGHPDYIDGRAIPFGTESFNKERMLLQSSLDSPLWEQEADRYHINTFVLPLARIHLTPLLQLHGFCRSQTWRPVYLDEISVIFVRRTPETEELIRRSEIDCSTVQLPVQPVSDSSAIAFNQWANAAAVLASLGRTYEATEATNAALQIFPQSGYVHYLRGNIFSATGRNADAEKEYLLSLAIDPNENTYVALARVYRMEGYLPEATRAMQDAARVSFQPHFGNLRLAYFYLGLTDPQSALTALDAALKAAPAGALAETGENSIRFQVARTRSAAYDMLGDTTRAISYDEEASQLAPDDPDTWFDLAKLYGKAGRMTDQLRAQKRAAELAGPNGEPPPNP